MAPRPFRLSFFTVLPSPYQREFFRALAEAPEFDVHAYYYAATTDDRHWDSEPLRPFETLMPGRALTWIGRSAHLNPGACRFLEGRGTDLVIVSDYSSLTAQLLMRRLARSARRWVFWGELPGFRRRGPLGRTLRRALQRPIRAADGVVAIGSRAQDAYRRIDGFPSLVANIPYHCNTTPFEDAAGTRPDAPSRVTFLFSGQMIERKGVDTLIQAFALVARDHHHVDLELIGDGPRLDDYRRMVPPALADRVIFLGFQQPRALPRVFAEADVFVLPSRHDGWGVVLNEAIASGLPIVASSGVAAADDLVVAGENGVVFPGGDVGALALCLGDLAADSERRLRLGRASRRIARDWTLAKGVERWLAFCRHGLGLET